MKKLVRRLDESRILIGALVQRGSEHVILESAARQLLNELAEILGVKTSLSDGQAKGERPNGQPPLSLLPEVPMDDETALKIIEIFQNAGMKIEHGARYSVHGQIAQLLNGCESLLASQPVVEVDSENLCSCGEYRPRLEPASSGMCPVHGRKA